MLTVMQVTAEEFMAQMTAEDVGAVRFPPDHPCAQVFAADSLLAAYLVLVGTGDLFRFRRGEPCRLPSRATELAPPPPGMGATAKQRAALNLALRASSPPA